MWIGQLLWVILISVRNCHSNTLTAQVSDNRVNGLTNALALTRHQIVNILTQVKGLENGYQSNMNHLQADIDDLREKLHLLYQLALENQHHIEHLQEDVGHLNDQIHELHENVDDVEEATDDLEEEDKRLRSSIVAVNKTFTLLRSSGCGCGKSSSQSSG